MLVVAATTSLVVVAFAIPLAALVRDVARDRATTAAERDAAALAPVIAATTEPDLLIAAIEQTVTGADGRLSIFTNDTQVGDETAADLEALALARDGGAGFTRNTGDGAEIYSPVLTGDDQVIVVRARLPDRLLNAGVMTGWVALAAVGAALVAAGCLVADRLARSLTRDAGELAETARALAEGTASARARRGGVREIADVAAALNALADRIDELRAAERERVADLSHRLRTPLTALRLEADRSGTSALTEGVDRLESAITQLVHEARRPLDDRLVASCDFAQVVRERVGFWAALAEDDGRSAEATIHPGPLPIGLSPEEAAAAVDALLNNVFTHTPDTTPYSVSLALIDGGARLTISDAGPGVSDTELTAHRGISGGSSTGLGLDIARHAATAAGGSVTIHSQPGDGFTVTMDIPLA